MPPSQYTPAKVTKTSSVKVTLGPVHNIVVLVSGTTDPINAEDTHLSHSYKNPKANPGEKDEDWYWGYVYTSQKGSGAAARTLVKKTSTLVDDVKKLETDLKKYNVAIFKAHGWSGDNGVANRTVSGGYLVDRLCGSNGEAAYYSKYLKQNVCFHLIGHSHGGNVINEMLKRMGKCEEWPAKWQVKTLVYLSTPFFQKQHQIDVTALHPGCKVVNVFNRYDLTQRVVANFSLHQLPGLLATTGVSTKLMGELVDKLMAFDTAPLTAGLKSIRLRDFDDRDWHADLTLAMEPAKGKAMYDACGILFKQILQLLDLVIDAVTRLNAEVSYQVVKKLEGKVTCKRKIVSNDLKARFEAALKKVKAGLVPTIAAFEKRTLAVPQRYPWFGVVADLYLDRFLRPIVDLIAVNKPLADGKLAPLPAPKNSLLDLVHDLAAGLVEVFDDTTHTPVKQLARTAFKDKLQHVEVTPKDDYYRQRDAAFNAFMAHLEPVEARYFASKSKADLLDLVFTLAAQAEPVAGATGLLENIILGLVIAIEIDLGDDAFLQILNDLLQTMLNYQAILKKRNFGGIVVPGDIVVKNVDPEQAVIKRGDLSYLMRISHSVSREKLHDQVNTILRHQITTA